MPTWIFHSNILQLSNLLHSGLRGHAEVQGILGNAEGHRALRGFDCDWGSGGVLFIGHKHAAW